MTSRIESLSAVTLEVCDMARSVAFYEALGFRLAKGGREEAFSTFEAGGGFLNLMVVRREDPLPFVWGRAIFHVADVDESYEAVLAAGLEPDFPPSDAPWGERYFHITDPDGHEISLARPL